MIEISLVPVCRHSVLSLAMHIYFKQLFRNCESTLITTGNCTWQADCISHSESVCIFDFLILQCLHYIAVTYCNFLIWKVKCFGMAKTPTLLANISIISKKGNMLRCHLKPPNGLCQPACPRRLEGSGHGTQTLCCLLEIWRRFWGWLFPLQRPHPGKPGLQIAVRCQFAHYESNE